MSYQMTAKDKAFQQEKQKLRKEAERWQQAYFEAAKEVDTLDARIVELTNEIALLNKIIEEKCGVDPEDLKAHMERTEKLSDMLSFLTKMGGMY